MAVPLTDSIEAFRTGAAYTSVSGMSELADIGLEAATSAADTIAETWSAVTKNLSTTLSVTSSQVKVIELEAKSQGREPTEEELDEACGPLGVLVKVPNALSAALSDIFGQVNEFASDFGQTIASFANDLNTLINDVATAVDDVVRDIAQAALDVFNTVNSVAIQALTAVEGAINAVVGFVNDAVAEAERLLNLAIDKLLGFADSLVVSALYKLECQEVAVENGIDADKVADAAEVDRVVGPTIVEGTESPISSTTLAEPQTAFAQVQTSVPPSLDQLIENFRSAARKAVLAGQELSLAFIQKRPSTVSIAERDALNAAADQEKNKLFLEAANQGVPANDLPIYGTEFNLTARGFVAAQQPVAASSKVQQTINELAPVKSRYDAVNQEQGQLAVRLKFDLLPSTPDNIKLFNEKNAEAKSLRQQLVSKIDALSPKDQQAVEKEIGRIPIILKP